MELSLLSRFGFSRTSARPEGLVASLPVRPWPGDIKGREPVSVVREEIMLHYDDAVRTILDHVRRLDAVDEPLLGCAGRVAAENVSADSDLPLAAVARMDGYAAASADVRRASVAKPVALRVIAAARAGYPSSRVVRPGTAIRIMTGSVVPKGADCVVRFEDTDEPSGKKGPTKGNPTYVKIFASLLPGENIRAAGSTVRKGTVVVADGALIGPAQISACASIGKSRIKVIRRPTVAIIATGDELVRPGTPLAPGKAYNCNTAAIAALVLHYGGMPRILGIARDNETSLMSKIRQGLTADVIVTRGGTSNGDYDLVRHVVGNMGKLIFRKTNMGPGAPVVFGLVDGTSDSGVETSIPVFCLAGPPAGCLVSFETLVRPALLKMLGFTAVAHPSVEATALDSISLKRSMALVEYTHLREAEGEYQVTLTTPGNAGMVPSMAAANSLTIIPAGATVKAGDKVQVLPLECRRDRLPI